MGLVAEELHERGRDGLRDVRRWLEGMLRFELPYDAYTNAGRCTLALANGRSKRFDMAGVHFDESHRRSRQIYVEVKNAKTEGNLSSDWIDFVSAAYSATHLQWDLLRRDPGLEFMFASTHPWSVSHYWRLTEPESLLTACKRRPAVMPPAGPDEDRVHALAQRIFSWIVPRCQNEMTVSTTYRTHPQTLLKAPPYRRFATALRYPR